MMKLPHVSNLLVSRELVQIMKLPHVSNILVSREWEPCKHS